MQSILPQTKTNDLLKELRNYSPNKPPLEFEVRRMLNVADKIKKVSASQGYMVSGLIYGLLGDYDNTVKEFNNALYNASDDYESIVVNYSIALRNLGEFSEALHILEKNYGNSSSPRFVFEVCSSALGLGLFEKAIPYYKKLKSISGNSYKEELVYFNNFITSCKALEIPEQELLQIYQLVLLSIYEHKVIPETSTLVRNYEDPESLLLLFNINADANLLAEISLDIAEKQAESNIEAIVEQKITPVILKKAN